MASPFLGKKWEPAGNSAMQPFNIKKLGAYSKTLQWRLEDNAGWLEDRAQLFYPDEQAQQEDGTLAFAKLCDKLKLSPRPLLIVADRDTIRRMFMAPPKIEGLYDGLSHSIILTTENFESLKAGEHFGTYIAAHEAGHASGHPTRRFFLMGGASVAAGIFAGKQVFDSLAPETPTADDKTAHASPQEEGWMRWTGRAGVSYMAADYTRSVAASLMIRFEEFAADAKASKAQGGWEQMVALSHFVHKEAETRFGADQVAEWRQQFSDEYDKNPYRKISEADGMSKDEAVDWLLAEFLATSFCKPFNLMRVLSATSYPSASERFLRAREKGEALSR